MSKISLSPDASGTGIFTIASPNSNTNRTLTLPDETGTIITSTGATTLTDLTVTNDATINGLTVGEGAGSVSTNTAVGASALAANTTGANNVAVGYQAGYSNTTGTENNSLGSQSLKNTTTGNSNNGLGTYALFTNTTGNNNAAMGHSAMYYNTTGSANSAFGYQALVNNTTASNNTAVGYQAGYSNTTGFSIAAFGRQAAFSNSTGNNLLAIGNNAGHYSTAGQNTLLGHGAGYNITTGQGNTIIGSGIDGVSYPSGYFMTTGSKNTILGNYNGNQGGVDIRTTSNNIVLSDGDGGNIFGYTSSLGHFWNTTGTYTQINWLNTGVQKASIWWDNSLLRLQTYTGTTYGPYLAQNGTSWTNSSDERLKNITGEIQNGLAKVCTLRAAEYIWKADSSATPQVGLIAQDVLAVLPEAVTVPEEGATEKDGSPAMMGVQYNEVIPLLVAAIKELKAEIDQLKGQ